MNEILIVEDDEMLNAGLCYNLQMEGYQVHSAFQASAVMGILKENDISLILMDVNLPDGDGYTLSEEIRQWSLIPIIFLTANDMDEDMIKGFEAGGDDYITKPFNIRVVMQRIKAILRRCGEKSDEEVQCGNLVIDFKRQAVKKCGELLILTPTEFKLLQKFCSHKGQVLTRQALLMDLWDADGNYVDEHTLTINISRLRSKIADIQFPYIKTIYGVGYQWIGEKNG